MTGWQFSVRSGFVQLVALAVVVWATDVRGQNVDSATTPVANARVAAPQAMAGGLAQVSSGQSFPPLHDPPPLELQRAARSSTGSYRSARARIPRDQ